MNASASKTKTVRVSGMTYRMETPIFEPVQDAAFYITCAGGAHAPLDAHSVEEPEVLTRFHPQWGKDSPYRIPADTPEFLTDWRHEMLTITEEQFKPFYPDVFIRDDRIEWFPDIFRGYLWSVSSRFKDIVEEVDPGSHYFFRQKLLSSRTKDVLRDDYYCWLPRRRYTYLPKVRHDASRRIYPNLMNPAVGSETHWQLVHNESTRAFFEGIPIWGCALSPDSVIYDAQTFRRLKAEGVTGLVEHIDGDEMLENPMATIGCIF